MAIKLKKEDISISDELNRELETLGFNITFNTDNTVEEKEDNKTEEEKKTTDKE